MRDGGSREDSGAVAGLGGRLPRGRHGIPRELVAANQRERILRATAELFDEQGYAAMVISDVIARAGVSRATFYDLFDDKRHCVAVAQQWAFDTLRERFLAACAAGPEWPSGVLAAVGIGLDEAVDSPGKARLVLASGHAYTEPSLAAGVSGMAQFVAMLDRGAKGCPAARVPEGLAREAAVGAAMAIVGSHLSAGSVGELPALRAELAEILLTPYLGAAAAARAAA